MAYTFNPFTNELDFYSGITTGEEIVTLLEALASGNRLSHDDGLSDVSADDHHAQTHGLASAYHTVAGLTTGHFLKATGTTTFAFAAHGLTYSDVGADVSGAAAAVQGNLDTLTSAVATALDLKANLAGPTFTGTVTVPSTNFTIGTQILTQTNLTDLLDGGDTTLHDHDGITENTTARHVAITLNATATTGGLSLSTQEIGFRAATNAQTGYATAAHILAIETNTNKATCNFANVNTALAAANAAIDVNSQNFTSVGAIGCGAITTTDNLDVADTKYVKTDKIRARNGAGLLLEDDGGNGLFIADGGIVTNPTQPAFSAHLTETEANETGDATVWHSTGGDNNWTEIFDQNNNFDGDGTFIAPVTGRYSITGFIYIAGLAAAHTLGYIGLITSNRTYYPVQSDFGAMADASGILFIPFTVLADMDANDTATLAVAVFNGAKVVGMGADYTYFQGALIC